MNGKNLKYHSQSWFLKSIKYQKFILWEAWTIAKELKWKK